MRHKIKIWAMRNPSSRRRLWYTSCSCRWEPDRPARHPDGLSFFGRPTWDAALAVGIAHQQNATFPLARSHSA